MANATTTQMATDLIKMLDDGTTMADILRGLRIIENDRERKRRNYVPRNGKPGRPRKNNTLVKDSVA